MHGLRHSSTFLILSGIPDSKFSLCAQSSSDACSVSPLTSRARPELCRGRWRQPNKEGLELRTQGMNSHPGRSLGSIPTSQERPRFQLKISLWKAYCSFSHCSQQFGSHLMWRRRRRRRNLQTDPSKPLPKLTQQPCPGEGVAAFRPFIHSNIPVFWGLAALSAPAGIGSAGEGVTVKELFEPQHVNVALHVTIPLTSNLPALCLPFIHVHIFSLAPLEYSTMISSLSFEEKICIYMSYIYLNGLFTTPADCCCIIPDSLVPVKNLTLCIFSPGVHYTAPRFCKASFGR